MLSDEFGAALAELIALAVERPTAIMCAEALPHRCHRSLVSDALTARGLRVHHIMDVAKARPHRLPTFARVEGSRVTYPQPA